MINQIIHSGISFLAIIISPSDTIMDTSHLFKIQRSKDANEIFYDLNLSAPNKLDTQEPINIYWIKHTKNSKAEPLTWIQKRYAYGVNYLKTSENEAVFHFVSYEKRLFQIKLNSSGFFHVYTILQNKEVIVNRIFIQIDGGTFWFPKVSRVELHAKDTRSNKTIIEIINP
jgi:hypothetical protein